MNGRIRELAEAANEAFYEQMGEGADKGTFYFDGFVKKFAELIVKDCMTMCDDLRDQYLKSRRSAIDFDEKNIYAEGEVACDIIKFKMKNYFGVE